MLINDPLLVYALFATRYRFLGGGAMTESITRRDLIAAAAATAVLTGGDTNAQANELTELTVEEAGRRIARRELSPVDLTRAYLERIERLNPRLNAYITVTAEPALAQARALEAEIAAGRNRGPLHGIPIGLKDNIDTAGILTTAASAVYAQRVPQVDQEVVGDTCRDEVPLGPLQALGDDPDRGHRSGRRDRVGHRLRPRCARGRPRAGRRPRGR